MIPQDTIQRIIETSRIVDVVQDFVTLKKRGVNYIGNCPFHHEKTPSFIVSPAKNIFKCFGCGEAGNPIQFVIKHEHLSYPDALKYLAKKYHIEIVEKELTPQEISIEKERESLLVVLAFAQKYFSSILLHHVEGKAVGLSYFKERGFTPETIEKFQLGYSLDIRDAFTKEALNKGYKLDYLEKTGLTIVRDDFKMDRFFGRVIFPIHSLSGRIIGFGGRVLRTDKNTAKYLNSPESEIYHKSNNLYGIYFAKNAIVKFDKCILVEGYTDMLAMYQAGIENVVASLGTSLTVNQIRLIKRFTSNLTIIYDGDPAGIKASLRGIDMVLEEEMDVKIVLLPDGDDPDSFSRKHSGKEVMEFIGQHEENFITFKTKLLINEAKTDPVLRAGLIGDIVRSIAVIPNSILRSEYLKECSVLLNMKEQALYDEVGKILLKKIDDESKRIAQPNNDIYKKPEIQLPSVISNVFSEPEEQNIVYFLLKFGNENFTTLQIDEENFQNITIAVFIISEIQNENLEFKNLVYKRIFEEYRDQLLAGNAIDENFFIHHTEEGIRTLAANLLSENYIPSKIWEKQGSYLETPDMTFKKDVPKAINAYKMKILKLAIENNENEIKELQTNGTFEKIMELLQTKKILDEFKMKLAKETGDRIIL